MLCITVTALISFSEALLSAEREWGCLRTVQCLPLLPLGFLGCFPNGCCNTSHAANTGLGSRHLQPLSLQVFSATPLRSLGTFLTANLLLRGPSSSFGSVMPGCSFQGNAAFLQSILGANCLIPTGD